MAADPHPRTPHAFLWVLIDAADEWWIFREFWPSIVCGQSKDVKDGDDEALYSVQEYVEVVASLEGNEIVWVGDGDSRRGELKIMGERPCNRFMDQAGKGFKLSAEGQPFVSYWDRYKKFGFSFREPYKRHDAGEDKIRDLLRLRKHETRQCWPRLHIAESCVELILEFKKYRYQSKQDFHPASHELSQKGMEKRCHLLDCLRYIATSKACYLASFTTARYDPAAEEMAA